MAHCVDMLFNRLSRTFSFSNSEYEGASVSQNPLSSISTVGISLNSTFMNSVLNVGGKIHLEERTVHPLGISSIAIVCRVNISVLLVFLSGHV